MNDIDLKILINSIIVEKLEEINKCIGKKNNETNDQNIQISINRSSA